MDVHASLHADCSPEDLFARVETLDGFPDWLDIVPRAEKAEAHPDDVGPAWTVTLRAKVGPLARAKRLRMVRTDCRPPSTVRYERVEHDGRQHSAWVLIASVVAAPDGVSGSGLDMHLHYGGSLWVPMLDRLLAGEIEASRHRLRALVERS